MHGFETVLALLVGVTFLALLARRLDIPTPAVLVAGGLLVALVPGLPAVQFDPQLVFLVFIPPLLYRASLLASYRDVRANLRPILLLGVGHVLFVTAVVAWVAHLAVPGLPWAAAFVLGAVVSPPDVAAATAFLRRLPLPRRLVTILEGESMVNDAAAIVAYRMAVAAAVTGTFSFVHAGPRFLLVGAGGVVIGLAVGWLLGTVRRHIHDPEVENTISLLTGYAAYLPAERLGVSGILAVGAPGRRGYAVPGPRPDHRDHVRRDPRDPAGPGVHARAALAVAGGARDGRRGAARGDRGPAPCLEGRARAAGGARDGAMDASGDARPHARPLPPSHAAAARPGEGRRGRR